MPKPFIRSLRGITILLLVLLAQPPAAGAAAGTPAGAAGGIPAGTAGGIPAGVEDGTVGRTGSEATGETQGRGARAFQRVGWSGFAQGGYVYQFETYSDGGLTYAVVDTPGHTPGGVCFHFKEDGVMFTGDTLFAGSVGRTDLPGGDSRLFLNNCVACHSGMDPLAQAFAYYDYVYDADTDEEGEGGRISYNQAGAIDPKTGTRVVAKYHINANNFKPGFVTPDDAWINYWRQGPNQHLGWDSALSGSGSGAKSMGQELAHSDAFAQCQVKKVFKNVCLRPPATAADRAQVAAMVANFANSGYQLKQVFADAAVHCMGD